MVRQPPVRFDCFKRSALAIPEDAFRAKLDYFRALDATNNHVTDYRNSFYFQFSCDFDGISSIDAKYPDPVPRSVIVMDQVLPFIQPEAEKVLFMGSHCGAEIFHALPRLSGQLMGVEANRYFVDFSEFLAHAFRLDDRISIVRSDVENFGLTPSSYDFIVLHGLLYMSFDPINLLKRVFAALRPGGRASIEIYVNNFQEPVAQFLSDGSGWGDTFSYSRSFVPALARSLGATVLADIAWGANRQTCVIERPR